MRKLEVRCCCEPGKLLGYLPVHENVKEREAIRYSYLDLEYVSESETTKTNATVHHVNLTVARFYDKQNDIEYLAIKDNGVSIEILRKISGFEEYNQRKK